MTLYQQSDSLSTDTNVPMSGPGSSTPEAAAGNASYSAWPWEVMLATVLGIAAPDRSEVTGQPWLTVQSNGQNAGGAHLIWTAGWDTSPNSGATSIQVYLNPALYTSGGAWDRFLNAPPQAMSGAPGGNYAGLPLNPDNFQTVSLSVATVRNWMATATDQFAGLYQQASSGPIAKFQGNLATVVAELLGDLRRFMASMHEQMSSPTAYDVSITTAGEAASQYLIDLMSAYTGWTQLTEHSPLGAVVQVLEEIATQDSGGAYVIPDPQNTPYGDLTVSGSWAAVEQEAKTRWTNALTGGSPDFAGLDPLGQAALNKLVDQFATTAGVIVPVLGPAPPPLSPNPVNPGGNNGTGGANGPGGGGPNNFSAHQPPGGGPGGPPGGTGGPSGPGGPGPALFAANQNGGQNGPAVPGGGPAGTTPPGPGPANLAIPPGGAGAPAGQVPGGHVPGGHVPGGQGGAPVFGAVPPVTLLAAGQPGQGGSPPGTTGNPARPTPAGGPGVPATDLATGGTPAFGPLGSPGGLSGAIGANPADQAAASDMAPATNPAGVGGFSGTIGRPQEKTAKAGSNLAGGHHRGKRGRKGGVLFGGRQAPAAGYSLGRDSAGPVLKQFAVPGIVAKPPAITSGPVNSQLAPASGGASGPAGLSTSATATPAGPQAQASSAAATPESAAAGAGETAMIAPGAAGANGMAAAGPDAGGPAMGAGAGEDNMMIMPPGGMGMRGGGQASRERQRLAYLPEEAENWGTAPAIRDGSLEPAGPGDLDDAAESESDSEFVSLLSPALGGIGALTEHEPAGKHISDRRMP